MNPDSYFGRRPALRALAFRDFRFLITATSLQNLLMPLQFLTMIFWMQEEFPDRDVVYVSVLGACRGVALLTFGFIGGAIADRAERRRTLIICESFAATATVATGLLMLTMPLGGATIIPVLALGFAMSANMAVDIPSRSASSPAVVGMENLTSAISLTNVAAQVTFPATFLASGLLNDRFGPGWVYLCSAGVYGAILPLLLSMRFRSFGGSDRARGVLGNIRDGLAYTRRDTTIFAVLLLLLVMQGLGMPGVGTLGILWMTEVLHLTRTQYAFLGTIWGFGALAASLFFAYNQGLARRGSILCLNVAAFGIAAIVFGHSRFIPLTLVANFTLGFSMVGAGMTASTMVQYLVSDEMRGRVMGLFPLAMGLAMVNTFPVGALAQATSLELVMPLMGWLTLFVSMLIIVGQPGLRRARPSPAQPPPATILPVPESSSP
ncbi:MAG: MFS transporter [Chloroflexi bacterium]|nr:MFS transporter [Chloroflexota bacterium]